MKITLLCNAGLALQAEDCVLLVDLPNQEFPPFYTLPQAVWQQILDRQPPFDRVCGLYFTHDHPDHCNRTLVEAYLRKWPQTPCFFPQENPPEGVISMGPFQIQYSRMPHVPIPDPPVHVVTMIGAGEKRLYLSADAEMDCAAHRQFLAGRRMTAAIWNSMYLSRPETRTLMNEAADWNYIYHMPQNRPDAVGLWRKVERNLERYGGELKRVTVWDSYPTVLEL